MSVEATGDVDVLHSDKTGTITLDNCQATRFVPLIYSGKREIAQAAMLSNLTDETPKDVRCDAGTGPPRLDFLITTPGTGYPSVSFMR